MIFSDDNEHIGQASDIHIGLVYPMLWWHISQQS